MAVDHEEYSPYQYALNNPINSNDPWGDTEPRKMTASDIVTIIETLQKSTYGGTWTSGDGGGTIFFFGQMASQLGSMIGAPVNDDGKNYNFMVGGFF